MTQATEQARLAELYAQMSEGELEKVVAESDELTDVARQALQAEIKKRNFAIEVRAEGESAFEALGFEKFSIVRSFATFRKQC